MVDLNDHDTDKRTENISSYILLLFLQHMFLLTLVLLILNFFAVNLTFNQTIRCLAIMPVVVVVQELGIFCALQWEAAGFNALLREIYQLLAQFLIYFFYFP